LSERLGRDRERGLHSLTISLEMPASSAAKLASESGISAIESQS
jgi:hypothetical protein